MKKLRILVRLLVIFLDKSIHPEIFEWRENYKKVALFNFFFLNEKVGGGGGAGPPDPLGCYGTVRSGGNVAIFLLYTLNIFYKQDAYKHN